MPRGWFGYTGAVDGAYIDPAYYRYVGKPLPSCTGSGRPCVAYAYYTPGTPVVGTTQPYPFSLNMESYLNLSGLYTLPLPLGSVKKYVYVRA